MSALAYAVIAALATDPRCGAAPEHSTLADHLVGIAWKESGYDPLSIGINADSRRDLPHVSLHFATAEAAVNSARRLIAEGRDIDLGLMGINIHYLGGLTIETAFDRCANMAEGARHYAADIRATIYDLAHRHYNAGYGPQSLVRGAAYAASIEREIAAIRRTDAPSPAPPVPTLPAHHELEPMHDGVPIHAMPTQPETAFHEASIAP